MANNDIWSQNDIIETIFTRTLDIFGIL